MSERDAMALLAEANPVQADDLFLRDAGLADRIVARRRLPSRRGALAAAIASAVLAASLIAVFASGGRQSGGAIGSMEDSIGPSSTLARPLPEGREVTLPAAAAAVGRPLVLPATPLAGVADVGPVWVNGRLPGGVTAAITFPSTGIFIEYTVPVSRDPGAIYQAIARDNPRSFDTIALDGGTGLVVKQNSDDTGHNFGAVIFVLDDVEIRVFGHYGTAALQSIAQSIVDQDAPSEALGISSPPTLERPLGGGTPVSLADATATLGARIVQPDTSVVSPSDAGAVWQSGNAQAAVVAVTYPAADVWVRYDRPADGGYGDRLARYQEEHSGEVAILDGVPARVVFHDWKQPHWRGFYPSVSFAAGGTGIAVMGHQSKAALEAIARSIIDRSRKPPPGQLGDVEGIQVYPYLSSARRTSVADASATLGAPVVLPARSPASQSWAEGTCPHAGSASGSTEFCAVWTSFRGSGLSVGYVRTPQYVGTRGEWQLSRGLGRSAHVLDLDGVPALAIDRDQAKGYPGRIAFDLDGSRIVVAGAYDTARLAAAARSIVRRYPAAPGRAAIARAVAPPTLGRPLGAAARRIPLAGAAAVFGGRIVLPRSPFVRRRDVGSVWSAPRAVAVTFPAQDLVVRYERPAPSDPLASFEDFQRGRGGRSSVILLDGGWALETLPASGRAGWSSVAFVAKGSLVCVLEHGSSAHLRHVADSILGRARR